MIIRQVEKYQFQSLYSGLIQRGYSEPMEDWYTVPLKIGRKENFIKLLPQEGYRFAVLQVNELEREEDGPCFTQITKDSLLDALLELLLWQGI